MTASSAGAAPACRRPRRARRALGLSGLEFGVNIPGTVGGAVRMNANAYGGELARVLEWVDVARPPGTDRRRPSELGFAYRRSNLGPREVVARASFALERSDPAAVKAMLADMRAAGARPSRPGSRRSARPSRTPTTRAPRAAPPASCWRRPAARASQVGGARFSPKHANFIENVGGERPPPTCSR